MGAMKGRQRLGATASRRVQRWPSHNHFAAIQPPEATAHPIDRLLDATPEIDRASRRARRVLEGIQRRVGDGAVLDDPKTYEKPFKVAFPITQEPGYRNFEYACHEGNYAMFDSLSGARALEKKAAAAKAAGK